MIKNQARDRKVMQNTILDIEKNRNIKLKEGAVVLK